MKLLIAVITFALTLGGLFLIETAKSPKENYAQIIKALKEGNTSTVVSAAPSPARTRNQFQTPAPTPTSVEAGLLQGTFIPTLTQTPTKTPSPTLPPTGPLLSPASLATPTPTLLIPSLAPQSTPEQSEKININTASYEELQKITGVGPVIAQRIIDYRNTNGPFQKIEDIKNVKGIGDKTFEKMKDEITI
jgi:competence ComEA-like helix-hairpin-helix protein